MTISKHIDFQVPGWGEFQEPPISRLNYRGVVMSDSPLMYLRLGESTGPIAYDEIELHHATVDGVLSWGVPGPIVLDSNTAVESQGTGGLVIEQTGWLPVGASERTIELWFRPNSNTVTFRGINYGTSSTGARINLIFTANEVSVAVSGCRIGVQGLELAGRWHHLALVFPANASRCDEFLIYLDGQLSSSSIMAGSGATLINTTDTPLHINQITSGTWNDCGLDELAVYGVGLSAERIQQHYLAATSPGVL